MITPEMQGDGVVFERVTEGGTIYVIRMLFNHRLTFGPPYGAGYYDDAWCYDTAEGAIAAANAWDPETQEEPIGWKKHPTSGRRDGEPKRVA